MTEEEIEEMKTMNYRIVELKFGNDPEKTYYKPQRKRTGGIVSSVVDEWEDYPSLRGNVCKTYEEALEIIKENHVEVIQYHPVNL
jgi:hypothetical protein